MESKIQKLMAEIDSYRMAIEDAQGALDDAERELNGLLEQAEREGLLKGEQ